MAGVFRRERRERSSADTTADTGSVLIADERPSGDRPRRAWTGPRLVALIAGVAIVSLILGIAVMQFIVSPAEVAARTAAPEAGPVLAPVEQRSIENTVITRGEVTYADAVAVTLDTGAGEDRPVVTGHVPEVGTVFQQGNIALEVAGRPVIVLPGELPAYRTLSVGMRGPDVAQLKAALGALGFTSGDPATDTYDWDTASGVGALYEQIGYPAATGGPDAATALQEAERGVRDAGVGLAQAQAALRQAVEGGATQTLAEQAAVNSANDAVSDAQDALETAQDRVLPTLPSSEALFLSDLPRRVDEVSVKRGDVLSGSPMSVSGATLTIVGTVSAQDAELLEVGTAATFPGPDGTDIAATVARIEEPKTAKPSGSNAGSEGGSGSSGASDGSGGSDSGAASRFTVYFDPGALSPEQIDALRGTNVRVRVPVASTDGDVLAVPIAALSAGSGGQDRVELLVDTQSGPDAKTELIDVTAGLAADGYVEISSEDARIEAGARVVVGR